MEWGSVVFVFQVQGYERVGIFDAIHKVASSLNHALVHQFLERFFYGGNAEVVEELVPETGINQVAGGMFRTAYVEVDVTPVFIHFLVYQGSMVTRVHITQIVCARTCESRHCIQFQWENGYVINLVVVHYTFVCCVPSPFGGMSQRRFACFGRQEFGYFGKFQGQTAFINHIRHTVLVVNGERFTPVTLA